MQSQMRAQSADYVRQLRVGEGMVAGRAGGPALPKGIQAGSKGTARIEEVKEESEEAEMAAMAREVEDEVELAMAAVMGDAECAEPAYAEATTCMQELCLLCLLPLHLAMQFALPSPAQRRPLRILTPRAAARRSFLMSWRTRGQVM